VKLKIGIDCQSTLGQKTGIGLYTLELLNALRRVAPQHEYLELNWGCDVVMRSDRRLRWQQVELPRRAHAARVDLLHVTGFDAPLWRPCPVILTVHDVIGPLFPGNFPPIARGYWAWWLPRSVRFADFVVSDSRNTKDDLLRLTKVPEARIRVVYPGVSPRFGPLPSPDLGASIRHKYSLPSKYLLYVGTIEPRKGLSTLVAAYSRVSEHLCQDLVIAGKKGWYAQGLFDSVRTRGLGQRVHFPGYVADEDLPDLYRNADLFVFPSTYEGFGLPPLEALACGTPVICSDAASLPEVVGDAALLFPTGNEDALATTIRETLEDGTLQRNLRRAGPEQARRFTWDETARQMIEVYGQVYENLH